MSNEQPSRPRKSGSSASPMGSTLAIVIAIAAVVVGFLILRNVTKDDSKTTATTAPTTTTGSTATTTPQSVLPTIPPTTVFTPTTTGATVLVANSSHQNGVAKTLSTALQGQQFQMGTPTNGATKEATTKIQYKDGDPAAQLVAQSVAALMGISPSIIETMPTPVSLADPTTLGDATVLILLGDDKAGKTLAQMTGATSDTTPATPTTA